MDNSCKTFPGVKVVIFLLKHHSQFFLLNFIETFICNYLLTVPLWTRLIYSLRKKYSILKKIQFLKIAFIIGLSIWDSLSSDLLPSIISFRQRFWMNKDSTNAIFLSKWYNAWRIVSRRWIIEIENPNKYNFLNFFGLFY